MYHRISRNFDRFRWLRSDGSPNFSQRISRKQGDARILAKPLKEIYSPNISILKVFEILYREKLYVLPLVKTGVRVDSAISIRDLISLLGGPFTSLITVKHKGDFIGAVNREPARAIARRDIPVVEETSDIREIIETLVLSDSGYVLVINSRQEVVGVITERDIINFLKEKITGVRVRDVMSSNIISVAYQNKICEIIREMNMLSVRRFPVLREDGSLAGVIRARDIIDFIGSHEVFKYLHSGSYEEFCRIPVDILIREASVISEEDDIGEASEKMIREDTDYFIVASGGEIKGIVTERDIVYGLAVLAK